MKSLFGRKKAEPQENPYAQQQAQDEYERMTPYQRARADLANNNGPPRPPVAGGLPSGPGPRRDYNAGPAQSTQSLGGSTYVESPSQGYGSNRYGSNQGYGTSRFDSNSTAFSANQAAPPARASGYGGLGGRPQDLVDNHYASKPQPPGGVPDRYAAGSDHAYAAVAEENDYADEELTQEQLEEREHRKIRLQQKDVRRDNLSSQQRSLAMLDQMEETGMRTLANLGSQGERLNRVEQNLNMSAAHAKNAEAKTKELKTLNRSMFAVHIENPLTKKSRLQAQEQAILEQSQAERGEREAIRKAGYQDRQNLENFYENMAERRNKYATSSASESENDSDVEQDDDDRVMSREEKMNNKRMLAGLARIKDVAKQQGALIDSQNGMIDRISDKTDGVTDHVVKNSAKLRTFK